MPPSAFALRDHGFRVQPGRDEEPVRWLFRPAWRATPRRAWPTARPSTRAPSALGRRGRDIKHDVEHSLTRQPRQPTRSFPLYTLSASPFYVHCLALAAKLETQDWRENKLSDNIFEPHWNALRARHRSDPYAAWWRLDFLICEALQWKLCVRSPFLCLSDLDDCMDLALPVETVMRADDAILGAVVRGVEANADLLAVAAMAAAATTTTRRQHREVDRAVQCLLTLALAPEYFEVRFADVYSLAELIEELRFWNCANPAARTPKKRPREDEAESAPSPNSVICSSHGGRGARGRVAAAAAAAESDVG